jgi:hypothetical protein
MRIHPHLRRFGLMIALACGISATLFGCKAKAGGSCENKSKERCVDDQTALSCGSENRYIAVACEGPMGCAESNGQVACDDPQGNIGDPCLSDHEAQSACTPDGKMSVTCKQGKYELLAPCKGPNACFSQDRKTVCDVTLADKGDACTTSGKFACSTDKGSWLRCSESRAWEVHRYCRGPLGCKVSAEMDPICDTTLAAVGDPCSMSNTLACSADGRNELICQFGRFAQSRECKDGGCKIGAGRRIECK